MARAISIQDTKKPRKRKKNPQAASEIPDLPGVEFLSTVDKTGPKWDENKSLSRVVGSHYHNAGGLEKLAQRVSDCAHWLGFCRVVREGGEVVQRLDSVSFCKARFCPVCAWRKSLFWVGRFKKALPLIQAREPHGRWVMLTLTVKNCDLENLRPTIAQMSYAWRKMIRRKDWPALGFVRSLEITRNEKTNQAHPHFHALLHVPAGYFSGQSYKPRQWWVAQWRTALGVDYEPVIDIRKATAHDGFSDAESAAVEVLKYSVKPSDLTACPAWLVGITEATHGSRYLSTGGTLKDCISEEVTDEDLRKTDDEEKEEAEQDLGRVVFAYKQEYKRYARHPKPQQEAP